MDIALDLTPSLRTDNSSSVVRDIRIRCLSEGVLHESVTLIALNSKFPDNR